MKKLVVAKFGGSAIGADGISIPIIIQRITELKKDSKVVTVFSAPSTIEDGTTRSITDIVLELGRKAEAGKDYNLDKVRKSYEKILEMVSTEYISECKSLIDSCLEKVNKYLKDAQEKREFADEVRSNALAFSGEVLMSYVMNYILKSQGIKSAAVSFDTWLSVVCTDLYRSSLNTCKV